MIDKTAFSKRNMAIDMLRALTMLTMIFVNDFWKVQSVSYGLAPILGDFYEAWLTFGNFAIVFALLLAMYRCGVFLKV